MSWTKAKLKRYIKEGRGKGEGEDYIPWTKIHEFPSKGRVTRIFGIKTNRIHQLHSDNQLRAFLTFEWSERVIDIREGFPLLDIMEVIDEKENLRLDKFCDKETGEQLVITTNFLLTIKDLNGNKRYIARSVRNASELNKKITFEKLEIERRYWLAKGIDWKVVTNKELNRLYCKNIEWIRETLLKNENDYQEYDKDVLSKTLCDFLKNNQDIVLRDLIKEFEIVSGINKGEGIYLFRYLIGIKVLQVDLRKEIKLSNKVKDIVLGYYQGDEL